MRVVWTFSFNFCQEKTNKVIFLASSISLSPFAILPHCFLQSLPDCSLLFSPVCVLTLRYPCELLLYQVWEWALPGSKASEHLQRWMLLFSDARSRLGRPLWNLPQQGRGCVHTRHMHGNTHVFASSLIKLCVLFYGIHYIHILWFQRRILFSVRIRDINREKMTIQKVCVSLTLNHPCSATLL